MDAIVNKNIRFDNRKEAENVLLQMTVHLNNYGEVLLADLYNMVGISPTFGDYKYGWRDLDMARVLKEGEEGYGLDLPEVKYLGEKGRASTDYRLTVVYSDGSNRTLYPSTQTDVSNLIAHEIRMCNNKEDVNIVTFHVAFAWKGK
jgi:hypothetical protein